jgi:hypothetical protein
MEHHEMEKAFKYNDKEYDVVGIYPILNYLIYKALS